MEGGGGDSGGGGGGGESGRGESGGLLGWHVRAGSRTNVAPFTVHGCVRVEATLDVWKKRHAPSIGSAPGFAPKRHTERPVPDPVEPVDQCATTGADVV